MKTNNTLANLKGMAKHTYNRVMSAMAEDSDPAMLHTFAALTEGAKAIALQSGNFSNLYIRGINKGMTAEEAANELTERAAALVSRKLRKIDMICAAAFLAEYISRQRKEAEQPEPTNPDNTPSTMNANETRTKSINGIMNQANRLMSVCNTVRNFNRADAIREIAFRYYDNIRACVGRFNYDDDSEYNKEYSRAQYMNASETIANTPANLAKLHTLAVNGTPMFYIWLDAVDDAATTSVYLTEGAARADIARLEADDKEAGIYEPDAYRIINAAPYFA